MLAKLLFCSYFIKILQKKEKTTQKLYKIAVKKDCDSVKKRRRCKTKRWRTGEKSKVFLLHAAFPAGELYCKEKTGETEKI